MKLAFFFFFVAIALAVQEIKILRSSFDLDPAASYKFGYEAENKIVRDEVGELKLVEDEYGIDQQVVVVKGSYSYLDPQGFPITVVFFADETGFHADGAHFPVTQSSKI